MLSHCLFAVLFVLQIRGIIASQETADSEYTEESEKDDEEEEEEEASDAKNTKGKRKASAAGTRASKQRKTGPGGKKAKADVDGEAQGLLLALGGELSAGSCIFRCVTLPQWRCS